MITKMFEYKTWADDRTLMAVEKIDRVLYPDSYAFALQQINHIVIVEELFRSRLEDKPLPHAATNTKVVPHFDELKARLDVSSHWYLDYVSTLNDGERSISFTYTDGKRGTLSINETLFHIVNHGSYHRGNIAHALDLAAVPHRFDGYGIFIHEVQPERRGT
ncbi:DinB family protein [Aurantivibrio plasticivorans]